MTAIDTDALSIRPIDGANDNPELDLIKIFDEVRLVNPWRSPPTGLPRPVAEVRAELLMRLRSYIVRRDQHIFNQGFDKSTKQ